MTQKWAFLAILIKMINFGQNPRPLESFLGLEIPGQKGTQGLGVLVIFDIFVDFGQKWLKLAIFGEVLVIIPDPHEVEDLKTRRSRV